jgi:hypothetical protein
MHVYSRYTPWDTPPEIHPLGRVHPRGYTLAGTIALVKCLNLEWYVIGKSFTVIARRGYLRNTYRH